MAESDLKMCPYEVCFEPTTHGHGSDNVYLPRVPVLVPDFEPEDPEPTKQREGDQVLPKGGVECVQDMIIQEMLESKRVGTERYGQPLMTFNGRKGFQDVAEEVRDLHVYLAMVQREAQADRETLVEVVSERLKTVSALGDRRVTAEIVVDLIMGWVVGKSMEV